MIKVENVRKVIKRKTVLEDINITFKDGRIYGLKGINGSGKTMLMKIISGLIYPTEGYVCIDEQKLGDTRSFPDEMGILIENPVFLDRYTGIDNLRLLASLNNRIGDSEIKEAMIRVGLEPDDRRKYKKYSLGMKQRLGIAAAIMEKPRILILDEPTNALDKEGVELLDEILKSEKSRGTLIIISCHDENKLWEYSDMVLTMENGKVTDIQERNNKNEV
ncbi:MAG: ATP-binding cassette domain-containing protein [Lachnospiraceae bacterium]|nr:ATP-binding cassette domain-containing protein [Lachnospiraceae bacterium]